MSSPLYKKIVLVGASGNLGKPILQALLADAAFNVTILSRSNSTATFPSNVNVIKVDYSDKTALTKALTGQDVVISAIGVEGLVENFDAILIEVAIRAGVKWIIPSEFGPDTDHPAALNQPVLLSKIANADFLKKNQAHIAHTFITTGWFLDWCLDNGMAGFDIFNHSATLYDEGQNFVSGTTLPHIGEAVAAVLHHPELTLNKRIYIADTTFTQQQALSLFEKYTTTKWTVKQITTESLKKQGDESFAKGDVMGGGFSYLLSLIFGGEGASDFEQKISNQALGLKRSSLESVIKEAIGRKTGNK